MLAYTTRSADGTELRCCDWRPEGEAAQHVLLTHGLGEHLGRFEHVGETLSEGGVRVLGLELRGHGLSGGRRGHVRRWSDYAADLDAAAALLPEKHCLFAHSTGALIALDRYADGAPLPSRMVLSSPLVGVAVQAPRWKTMLARPLALLLPTLAMDNEIKLEDLSSDADAVDRYRRDALRVSTVTPSWYREMTRALERLWSRPLPDVPLQLHIAEDERLICNDALRRLEQAWPGPIETHRWDAMHELHQDVHCESMLELAKDFLLAA